METFRYISLGAGVQSSVLLLMASEGYFEDDTPDIAYFADTMWEPKDVYSHLDWLETVSNIPIERVSNGRSLKDDVSNNVQQNGRPLGGGPIPTFTINQHGKTGMAIRQCTQTYKIQPIMDAVRNALGVSRILSTKNHVEAWLGISLDEATRTRTPKEKYLTYRYPLIEKEMTRQDARDWFASHYPERELPRSACVGCPFHSSEEWLNIKFKDPEEFQEAVEIDKRIRTGYETPSFQGHRFLHWRAMPLDEAVKRDERDDEVSKAQGRFDFDCTGHCYT